MVCHRRAGKTVAAVCELILRALRTPKKNARYAYVAPYYAQAKDVAWEYLKEYARPFVQSASDIRESELRVKLVNGAWITLYGSDNIDRLRGLYLDGVVIDEYGDCRPSLWGQVVRPTLADRKGWAVFIGTFKGKNHFFRTWEQALESDDWFHLMLKGSTSGLLPEEELQALKRELSEEEYEQEIECNPNAAVRGTYYAKMLRTMEDDNRFKQDLFDPEQDVNVAADLGFTDSTAFWFWQSRPDGFALVDYYEEQGKNLEHYFDMLTDKPYHYGTIWLPHDARAKTLQTGRSTIEQFLERKFPVKITPSLSLQHGIDAARKVLPRCWFQQPHTNDGVETLRAYRRKYDEVNKVFLDKPLHDWASNGADSFRYFALVCRMSKAQNVKNAPRTPFLDKKGFILSGYTLNDLWNEQKRAQNAQKSQKLRI